MLRETSRDSPTVGPLHRHLRAHIIDVEDEERWQPSLKYGSLEVATTDEFCESIPAESKSQRLQLVLVLYSVSVLNPFNYCGYATLLDIS